MNITHKDKVSLAVLTKGLSITLTRPECTDTHTTLGYNDRNGSGNKSA